MPISSHVCYIFPKTAGDISQRGVHLNIVIIYGHTIVMTLFQHHNGTAGQFVTTTQPQHDGS